MNLRYLESLVWGADLASAGLNDIPDALPIYVVHGTSLPIETGNRVKLASGRTRSRLASTVQMLNRLAKVAGGRANSFRSPCEFFHDDSRDLAKQPLPPVFG